MHKLRHRFPRISDDDEALTLCVISSQARTAVRRPGWDKSRGFFYATAWDIYIIGRGFILIAQGNALIALFFRAVRILARRAFHGINTPFPLLSTIRYICALDLILNSSP